MKNVCQILHLALLVLIAGVYAWLLAILPAEDERRTRISEGIAIVAAMWGALLFIEWLRADDTQCRFQYFA